MSDRSDWDVLGLPRGASPDLIRKQYLLLVQENPPEQNPKRFQEIRDAYERLNDPIKRVSEILTPTASESNIHSAVDEIVNTLRAKRLTVAQLQKIAEGGN